MHILANRGSRWEIKANLSSLSAIPCRFRRERQHTADVEKGDGKDAKDGETSKKLTAEEGAVTVAKTRPGKWGRLLGEAENRYSL